MIQIGDKIKCINVGKLPQQPNAKKLPPLKLNGYYIVQNIQTCSCGHVIYDVGISSNYSGVMDCLTCSKQYPATAIHWCASERFIKEEQTTEYSSYSLPKKKLLEVPINNN